MSNIENYKDLIARKAALQQQREEHYKDESKERLKKIATKKVQTTMIGAISAAEKKFGFLFGFEKSKEELSAEEQHMRDLFMEFRDEVLDLGNKQMNNLEMELNQYDIKWNRYQLTLPVKKEE